MSYVQMSGSMRVASIVESPSGDVEQCLIPNTEIICRILLAHDDAQQMCVKELGYRLDRPLDNRKGSLSILNKMVYGAFMAVLLRSKHCIFSNLFSVLRIKTLLFYRGIFFFKTCNFSCCAWP